MGIQMIESGQKEYFCICSARIQAQARFAAPALPIFYPLAPTSCNFAPAAPPAPAVNYTIGSTVHTIVCN